MIVAILYSAGWYYLASKFEDTVRQYTNAPDAAPVAVRCDDFQTGGFPLLIGFSCKDGQIGAKRSGYSLSAGAVRAAAKLYHPGVATLELDSPASLSLAEGTEIDAEWASLRSEIDAGFQKIREISLRSEEPAARILPASFFTSILLGAKSVDFGARAEDADLSFSLSAIDFTWSEEGLSAPMPPIRFSAKVTLEDQARLLAGVPLASKEMSGTLTDFRIDLANGMHGEMSGPFTIDAAGYLSGSFTAKLEKLDLWERTLLPVFPEAEGTVSGVATLLRGLAKGKNDVTVNLSVDSGLITLSLLPVGHIPPI